MSYQLYFPNENYFNEIGSRDYWFEVWINKEPIDITKFEIVLGYYTGIEAFGHKELGGEPGPTLLDIEAMQKYIQKQFPEGWMIKDGEIVSAKV